MYKSGDRHPFNGSSETFTFERTWNEVKSKSDFQVRRKEVQEFNRYVEMLRLLSFLYLMNRRIR